MIVKIGENIKKLRKKADVTQERFAEYLGITAQAVSKWEVEGGYPDIEFLPTIANFFNITIDELMCYDISKNQEKIEKIIKQIQQEKGQEWLKGTVIAILRNAIQEFPNNYDLLYYLARALRIAEKSEEEKQKNLRESISICIRILEDCTDDNIRLRTLQELAYTYNKIGDKKKALEAADKIPIVQNTRNMVLSVILDGETKSKQIVQNIWVFSDMLWAEIENLADFKYKDNENTLNIKKRIELYKKMINIEEILHENKDYAFEHLRLRACYGWLSEDYIKLKDYDNALDCIEKYAEHSIKFDALPEVSTYTSVIFENEICPKNKQNDVKNASCGTKEVLTSNEFYAPIREHLRFKAVITELDKYTKKM